MDVNAPVHMARIVEHFITENNMNVTSFFNLLFLEVGVGLAKLPSTF